MASHSASETFRIMGQTAPWCPIPTTSDLYLTNSNNLPAYDLPSGYLT